MIDATYSDKNTVVDILAVSFDDNKSVNYIVKQDGHRKQRLRQLMGYSFDVCNSFGRVLFSENKKACALVVFPDQKKAILQSILWDIKLITGCIGLKGVSKALSREKKIKDLQPKEPLYYLWFIGVKPDDQHKGIGSALLREIIQDAEQQNRTLCLETSTEKNIPWYRNHGFIIYNELDIGYRLFFFKK